ncbi:SGNH/GDSL hydrolase family protein [Streptomyces sp. NPDC044571]|uniref:SGNH/GDSL hydrolase family protein n=1 Tax=Streptomyces sp. NPDC044571 TaxID=3155371 RepID=UPI00340BB3E3
MHGVEDTHGGAPAGSAGRRDLRGTLLWWGPRMLFVAGAVFLVVESSRGVPLPELYLALGFFGLCSAVFVGRQLGFGHERAPGERAPRWLIRAAALLSTAGVAVLVVHAAVAEGDALPLVGSVLLLLGLGWFVEAWRGAGPGRPSRALLPWGTALMVVTALTAALAGLLLPRAKGGLYVALLIALGVALFVFLPLGLNLLSEWGVRRLRSRRSAAGTGAGIGAVGILGLVVIVAVALSCVWLVRRDWMLAAVLVAAALLLLPAVVSNTHADVALVLAALCLLAAAPPEHPAPPDAAGGQRVLVALGDSYMSGEGASSYFRGTDDGGRNECRRSPSAYAVGLASGRRFDRMVFLACSGARTYNLNPASAPGPSRAQPGERGTQIDRLRRQPTPFHPALVIVTVGGNDAGFAILGEACLAPGDCRTQKPAFVNNLPKVRRDLIATYRSLRKALPADVPVVAVPYPQPIAAAGSCTGVALTEGERDFIRTFVEQLDTTMREAADRAGVTYMAEMKDSLATHRLQLCERRKGAAGINFVDIETVNGLAAQRFSPAKWLHNSLHPNERGHAAMQDTFTTWLDSHPELLPPAPTGREQAAGAVAAAEPEPLCGMTYQAANAHCRVLIRAWELEQVRSRWPWLLLVLCALAVLWAASIAAFSLLPATGRSYPAPPASARAR